MNKTWLFLIAGIGVVGIIIASILVGTKSNHIELDGSILKVRTVPASPQATIAAADFRVTNPSGLPFVVDAVEMILVRANGETITGTPISKSQMDVVFANLKLLGPKYNDMLTIQDRVPPGQTIDRMAAARFEVPESEVDKRQALRLRITEIDGTVAEITEAAPAKLR